MSETKQPTKFALLVEYDGTRYHGFQWQAGLPTIQAELEKAVKKLCGETSRVMAASRTDTGVHAKGQVVSFWINHERHCSMQEATLVKALNYYLPSDIAVKAAYRVNKDFNVRSHALNREYYYYILNGDTRSPFNQRFALFMPRALDVQTMREACQLIHGEHDFASFATSLDGIRNTVRHVYEADIAKKRELVIFHIVANSFLPHQVRNTIGLLLRLGLGKITVDDFCDIIEAKNPGLAAPTAPACGLWLTNVNYAKPLGDDGT